MKFNHEEAGNNLLAEGEAEFEVLSAEDQVSKTGNEMIKLHLKVWDCNGKQGTIFDYLLEKGVWRIEQFCESTLIPVAKFKSGELNAVDCSGKTGKLTIKTQKDKSGQYPDKSSVSGYLPRKNSNESSKSNLGQTDTVSNKANKTSDFDDDIPF